MHTGTRSALPETPGHSTGTRGAARDTRTHHRHRAPLGRPQGSRRGAAARAADRRRRRCGACRDGDRLAGPRHPTDHLVRGSGLPERLEPLAGDLVAEALREAGVDIRFGALETVGLTPGSRLAVDDTCRVTDVAGGRLRAVGDVAQGSSRSSGKPLGNDVVSPGRGPCVPPRTLRSSGRGHRSGARHPRRSGRSGSAGGGGTW